MAAAIGLAGVLTVAPIPAFAAELPGETMSLLWALPFAGVLLCIATGPLLYHHFWEHHYGKIALVWALLVMVPLALAFGFSTMLTSVLHTVLLEYVSFI